MKARRSTKAILLAAAFSLLACGQGAAGDSPTASPADPLKARAHLPMPWRIIGASFVSLDKGETGWAPGIMAEGYYLVEFDEAGLTWKHADIEDHYACTLGADGAFQARNRSGTKFDGHVDLVRGELIWQGKKYRVCTYEEVAREKKAAEPTLKPTNPAWPIKSPEKGVIQIDLKSKDRGRGGLSFAMGELSVTYLGHQGPWAIVQVYTNIEMGQGLTLYRLPISDGTATIRLKDGLPSYSFAKVESKMIRSGLGWNFGDPTSWTATAKGPARSVKCYHDIYDASGKTNAYVWTVDFRPGKGREVQPKTQVEVQLWFYADKDYAALRPDAAQGNKLTFTVDSWKDENVKFEGRDGVSKALDGIVRGMSAGGWRRAQLNQAMALDLKKFLSGMKPGEVLYVEINLLTIEDIKFDK